MSKKITPPSESREVHDMSGIILKTFAHFGIDMKLVSAKEGLRSYHFELEIVTPVRMKMIEGFASDLKYALSTSLLSITAPLPGKKLIGIEVTKPERPVAIPLENILSDTAYADSTSLTVPLGVDDYGVPAFIDISKVIHILIGGTTGSGKSTLLHSCIVSLIRKNAPDQLRLILIDPKRIEFSYVYEGLPHLLTPVITESKKVCQAISWVCKEMERRYDILESVKCSNITQYHSDIVMPAQQTWKKAGSVESDRSHLPEAMPYIVIIIDEFSDVMASYPQETEALVIRLTQMSRAVGIHLIIATSRPSTNVISTAIKANIPTRIAMNVASYIDSRILLDQNGAEKLYGFGDMLCLTPDSVLVKRYQGYMIDEEAVKTEIRYIISEHNSDLSSFDIENHHTLGAGSHLDIEDDELYEEAKAAVLASRKASTSYLQRVLRVGYARAARLIDLLEARGVIGPIDGAKPREILE